MEFNPIEKTDELMGIFRECNSILHSKSDDGFDWLSDGSYCIEIPNPDSEDNITIECEDDGEFTVCFSYYHQHFFADDFGYDYMCKQIFSVLSNKCCSAALFCSNENEWLGSTLIEKEQCALPIENIFDFVLENEAFAEKLNKNGGEARFVFWDSGLNKTVKI